MQVDKLGAFSVVMSIYSGDNPSQIEEAISSVLVQTLVPREFIIVIDGQISEALWAALDKYKGSKLIKIFELKENIGLAGSRNYAIKQASYNFIAVMDADDICDTDRFAAQFEAINSKDVDVVGGQIIEFSQHKGTRKFGYLRKVPLNHQDITERGKLRSPINHVTLMFKKDAFLSIGGYRDIKFVEDYELFHRLLMNGAKFINMEQVLVYVRSSSEQYKRRLGWSYLKAELNLQNEMKASGYLGRFSHFRNIFIRCLIRFLPPKLLGLLTKKFLRLKHE